MVEVRFSGPDYAVSPRLAGWRGRMLGMPVKETSTPARRRWRLGTSMLGPLWLQVLVSIALGIAAGVLFPHASVALRPLGDGFVRLIRMTLAPLIFLSMVIGIARLGDLKEVGRIGLKALVYFEVVSTIALLLGLGAAALLRPGAGMNIDVAALNTSGLGSYTSISPHHGIGDFLLSIIPSSVAEPFVSGNMLQILLLGILFGLALAQFRDRARPLMDVLDLVLKAVFGVVHFIMLVAPIAAFGAIAFTIGEYGIDTLLPLMRFVAEVWSVSTLFVLAVLGVIAGASHVSLLRLLRYIGDEIVITLGTASSEAVMAPLMTKMERMGCGRTIVEMVLPASYAFNADGTAIFAMMGAVFIAQATNTHLGLAQAGLLLAALMLVSKGSAGVAGAGFVTLAAALATVPGIPMAGLMVLLGIDRLTTPIRAIVNVIGNCVATIVVARWEHAYDAARAELVLNGSEMLGE